MEKNFFDGLFLGLCGRGVANFEGSDIFEKGYVAGSKLRALRNIDKADQTNSILNQEQDDS